MNASVYVYTCTIYMPGSHRGQKMALESLVMELQMFLSNHVGAGRKTRSFARTIALNCWTTAPGFLTLTYILLDLQKQIPVLAKLFHSHDFESHPMWCLTICKATFSCKSLCYFSLKKKSRRILTSCPTNVHQSCLSLAGVIIFISHHPSTSIM